MGALMNEIERWYTDVEDRGAVPDEKVWRRDRTQQQYVAGAEDCEESNVRFRIEEKKIIVLP